MSTTMEGRLQAIEEKLLSDEYGVAKGLVGEAQRLMTSPPPLPPVAGDPFTDGEISEAWITSLIDRKDAQDRLGRRRAVLLELVEQARARCTAAADEIRDQVLAGFHGELVRLLDETRQVAQELGGVDSAEAAIAADKGSAWKRLTALAGDYVTLRGAQLARTGADLITRSRPSVGGEDHASDLYLRNLDDIWAEWRTGGAANGVTITRFGGGGEARYEPWPDSQPALLLWLATSSAQPWIPTSGQLQRLWAERAQRANAVAQPADDVPVVRPNTGLGMATGLGYRTATPITASI